MKNSIIFLLCLCTIFSCGMLFAAEEDTVTMNYACRDLAGALRWQATSRVEKIGADVYAMTEKAQGIYSGFSGRVSWEARMVFENTLNNIRPMKLEKRVFDSGGKVVRVEKQEFDLADNSGICTHEEPLKNISRTRKFRFNKDVVNRLSLGLYAKKFLESGKKSEKLQMVSEEPKVYEVELKRLGKETIDINGRKVTAYRLCIDPRLGLMNFVKVFLPKAYAWHSMGPGYEWLGYAGLEGGMNSEKVEVMIEGS